MRRIIVAVALLLSFTLLVWNAPSHSQTAQQTFAGSQPIVPYLFNGSTFDVTGDSLGQAPAVINPTTATTTVLIPATAAKTNRINMLEMAAVATQTVKIVAGTQVTNPCDTGTVTLSPTYQLAAGQDLIIGGNQGPYVQGTAVNQQICATTSAAASVFIAAHYGVY